MKKYDVRMSFSYLFIIKINNQYLLIKGKNIEQYQPIGGVYKHSESFESVMHKYNIRHASNNQFYDEKDLRIIVPSNNVIEVKKWFDTCTDRETETLREFQEELIQEGPLEYNDYLSSTREYIRRREPGLRQSVHFDMQEYNVYEVYQVKLSEEAKNKILNHMKNYDNLILVDAEDIKREKISINNLDKKIGSHAKYLL